MPKPMAEQTPREVDTQLAEAYGKLATLAAQVERAQEAMGLKYRPTPRRYAELEAQVTAAQAQMAELVTNITQPGDAEYLRRGWKRYFLVTNGNGHVHRGRNCSTCFYTTKYAWLPELSGCDEMAMVAEYGELACTVCFPEAPSLYAQLKAQGRVARTQQERDAKRDERNQQRAERAAAKAAKAITDVDGKPLKGEHWTISTLAAAKMELTDISDTIARGFGAPGSYNDKNREHIQAAYDRIAAAIAAKTGCTAEQAKADAQARAARRR